MEEQRLGNAAVGAIQEKKARFNFLWPSTDTLEHARDAAKSGSIAFGYLAIGAMLYAVTFFAGHLMTAEDRFYSLIVITLYVYLTWRTYKRPTILLNCIAFVLTALVLGLAVTARLATLAAMAAVTPRAVASLCLAILGTLAAVGGIRGSLAVRRFKLSAPSAGAAVSS